MDQVKFVEPSIRTKKEIEKNKSKIVDELLSKPFIKEKINQLGITLDKFNHYLGYFVSYAEDYEHCLKCKSLKTCNKEVKGIKMDLEVDEDGDVIRVFELCKWAQVDKQIKNNYVLRDFSDEFLDVELENLDERQGRTQFEVLLWDIELGNRKKGLYVYGKANSGKSYPLIALCNSLVKKDITCAYINIKDFIESLKRSFNSYKDEYSNLIDKAKMAQVLVIDDLGEEKASAWTRDDVLSSILDHRNKNNLLTFITSCYTLDEIFLLYHSSKDDQGNKIRTEKFIERIKNLCEPIKIS